MKITVAVKSEDSELLISNTKVYTYPGKKAKFFRKDSPMENFFRTHPPLKKNQIVILDDINPHLITLPKPI